MGKKQLRQVIDLYTVGRAVPLRDGSLLWIQALNPFEQDTARNEAQIARARITLALKEFGSDEQAKVRMFFFEDGIETAKSRLVDAKVALGTPRILDGIRNDPDWKERLEIIDRGDLDTARPLEDIESQLLIKVAGEFSEELGRRLRDEREFQIMRVRDLDEDMLWAEYLEWYLDRRANEVMLSEFRLHQILFGTRWCEATETDGDYDHSACNGHADRVFSAKDEVRAAPEDLQFTLLDAFDALELTVREAKNSDRQGSSSDSSPLPSGEAASTASTPTETRVEPLGTSLSPSAMPSPSSASVS